MRTVSQAIIIKDDENISQGDVFQNVKYLYMESEDNTTVNVVEFVFPMAIIISQACDVESMGEMVSEKKGKSTKFMPSVLMCPVYDKETARKTLHLSSAFKELDLLNLDSSEERLIPKEDIKVASKDWHYRFHDFSVAINKKSILENAVIDFKHYFTVPASYLLENICDRIFRIVDLYAEQITLKFSTFLSRVAIPSDT